MKMIMYPLLLANAITAFFGLAFVIPSGAISSQLIDRAAGDGDIDKLRSIIHVLQTSHEATDLLFLICVGLLAANSLLIWIAMRRLTVQARGKAGASSG